MKKLHKSKGDDFLFEPIEGQQGLLCSNNSSSCCPSLGKEFIFSQETMDSIIELGEVLRPIRKRLFAEGYTIVDGKLKKLDVIKY
jgi:hypothetical protein